MTQSELSLLLTNRIRPSGSRITARGPGLLEAELCVEPLSVAGVELDRSNSCDEGTFDRTLDEPFSQPLASMCIQDEDIAKIRVAGLVGDDSGETDLAFVLVESEAERVFDGPFHDVHRQSG